MKDYLPLKVEFCLYESLLCGRILQQDDRLIEKVDKDNVLIRENNNAYRLSICDMPDLCDYTLYLRGTDKRNDNSVFYYEYINKQSAEVALKNFKELIKQVNERYYEEEVVEQKNTYYVEVCE